MAKTCCQANSVTPRNTTSRSVDTVGRPVISPIVDVKSPGNLSRVECGGPESERS